MRKQFLLIGIMVVSLVAGCGGDKYADVKDYMEKSIRIQEEYVAAIEKADSAGDIARAINKFAERLNAMKPQMKALMEKYPEIMMEKEPPSELREVTARQMEMAAKIEKASQLNVQPYTLDPVVVEATKNLSQAMGDH